MPPRVKGTASEKLADLFSGRVVLGFAGVLASTFGLFMLFPDLASDVVGIDAKDRRKSVDLMIRLMAVSFISLSVLYFYAMSKFDAKARKPFFFALLTHGLLTGVILLRRQLVFPGVVGGSFAALAFIVTLLAAMFVFVIPERYSPIQRLENRNERLKQQVEAIQQERDNAVRQQDDLNRRLEQLTKANESAKFKIEEMRRSQTQAAASPKPEAESLIASLQGQVASLKEQNAQLLRDAATVDTEGRSGSPIDNPKAKPKANPKPAASLSRQLDSADVSPGAALQRQAEKEAKEKKERKDKERKDLEEKLKERREKEQEELKKILEQ